MGFFTREMDIVGPVFFLIFQQRWGRGISMRSTFSNVYRKLVINKYNTLVFVVSLLTEVKILGWFGSN